MSRRDGFTLIELMIVIAILSIVIAGTRSARNSVHGLTRESDYRFALRNARHQEDLLRSLPFDAVPPRTTKAGPDGRVPLPQADVVPGSVTVRTLQGAPLLEGATPENGALQVPKAVPGQAVVVDYRFYLPDRNEPHTVPSAPPYRVPLVNTPALRLDRTLLARGDALTPVAARLDETRTGVLFPPEAAGRVAVIDYLGERIRNQVSGRFLTEDLQPTLAPGPVKLLRIQESYGDEAGTMSLTLLKVQP